MYEVDLSRRSDDLSRMSDGRAGKETVVSPTLRVLTCNSKYSVI